MGLWTDQVWGVGKQIHDRIMNLVKKKMEEIEKEFIGRQMGKRHYAEL